jgi:hypothetical protein
VPWVGIVFGDGYDVDTPGPNIDPNIFADLLPWHLSFCRIGDRKEKNLVGALPAQHAGAVLSEVVAPGDLVAFGGALSTHTVFIDTVLCVDRCPELPQRSGSFMLEEGFPDYWVAAGGAPTVDWPAFAASRVFRWNLKDSMRGGHHEVTGIRPHRQIVGRRGVPSVADRNTVHVALKNGEGFNFIPLAEQQVSSNKAVRARPGLFTARVHGVGNLIRSAKSRVWRLPDPMAADLVAAVAFRADVLVTDPLEPDGRDLK